MPASVAEKHSDETAPKKSRLSIDDIKGPLNKESWGFELLMNLSGCAKTIDSRTVIRDYFKTIISEIKMKTLSPLIIERAPKNEGRGLSAMQLITTSTIVTHFDEAGDRAFIDIFSCKEFDRGVAERVTKEFFKPKKFISRFLYRDA